MYKVSLAGIHAHNTKTKSLLTKELSQLIAKTTHKPFFAWVNQQNQRCAFGKMLILGPIALILTIPIVTQIVSALLPYMRHKR